MVNQEKLLEEIKALSDSIRKKNRSLRLGISERDKFLEQTFKPVVEPLKDVSKKLSGFKPKFEADKVMPLQNPEVEEEFSEHEEFEHSDESEGIEDVREAYSSEAEEEEEEEEQEQRIKPSDISLLGSNIALKGELGRKYVLKMLHSSSGNRKYHVYGARLDSTGLMIGNTPLDVDEKDNILIGNKKYKGTKGLFELIFKNIPGKHTKSDLAVFKEICKETNAHKRSYLPESSIYRNRSIKYKNVISELFPSKRAQIKRRAMSSVELDILHKKRKIRTPTSSGEGLLKNSYSTNVIYYNNINKLVDRMRLVHEAMKAGHTGLDNEWVALTDELRNRGIVV